MNLKIKGKDYPVTDQFAADVLGPHPDLASMPYADLVAQQKTLLDLSTARHTYQVEVPKDAVMDPAGTLTIAEAARLANITHVINCHNALNFLGGRSHTEFGFDGLDQVHGNRVTHLCGCQTQHVFDHHKARAWDPASKKPFPELHPHFSRRACDRHKHLALDFRAHRAAVLADPLNNPKPAKK